MDPAALAALPAVKKVLDVLRYLFDGDETQWKPVALVGASWVLGILVALLVAGSSFAASVGLVDASWPDVILAGIGIGSAAGVVADLSSGGVTIK